MGLVAVYLTGFAQCQYGLTVLHEVRHVIAECWRLASATRRYAP